MIKFKLRSILGSREITQKKLAEETGMRPSTLSAICNNNIKEIPVTVMDKICTVLDCQPQDWITYIKEDKEET